MRPVRLLPVALLSAAFTATAVTAADKPLKGDLAKIQGRWAGMGGPQKDIATEYTFEGDSFKLRFTSPSGDFGGIDGRFKMDESAMPHRTIDFVEQNGLRVPRLRDTLAIYAFMDDETLKICNPVRNARRPDDFVASEGGGSGTIVLKRVAGSDKPK